MMGGAKSTPILTPHGSRWQLVRRFDYAVPGTDYRVSIPAGFSTNFASVPWYARWLISPVDPTLRVAALVHDYLVGEFADPGLIIHADDTKERVSWRKAAAILRRIMDDDGARTWKRQAVYWAVRLHGAFK